jgi:hypothetical protein
MRACSATIPRNAPVNLLGATGVGEDVLQLLGMSARLFQIQVGVRLMVVRHEPSGLIGPSAERSISARSRALTAVTGFVADFAPERGA